ncbi:MAG: PKD domain-containing protein [Myxococcota bacterium]
MTPSHRYMAWIAAAMFLVGCGSRAETCQVEETAVYLLASPSRGKVPFQAALTTRANGFSCGCCGGKPPTSIVQYDWDTNGDRVSDESGSSLSSTTVTVSSVGSRQVTVTVTDSDGTSASNVVTLVGE